jgi:hypothetical protein
MDSLSGLYRRPDGASYMPSNGTEGDIFESAWCAHCAIADMEADYFCPIMCNAHCGEQPAEWIYKSGRPHCTAFVPLGQPIPEPRCPHTLELPF